MCYIPNDWIKNPDNEKEIRELLETSCFVFADNTKDVESRLRDLGETIIIEKMKQGVFNQ